MNYEELKVEAAKLGYKLVKVKTYVRMLPCPICGKKSTEEWICVGKGKMKKCKCCIFKGDYTYGKMSSNEAWNIAVNRYLEQKDNTEE